MRIRTIKPEFWASEGVASVDIPARLMFVGMWCMADDYGRGKANAKLVKSALFPLDQDVSVGDVEMWITQLESAGLISRYEADDRVYFHIPAWEKHQAAAYRRGEAQHPAPTGAQPARLRVQLSAGREGNLEGKGSGREQGEEKTRPATPVNRTAEVLLAFDSRAQYLVMRLGERNDRWRVISPAALMKLAKDFDAAHIIEALSYVYEQPDTAKEPYPYLVAVCQDIAERQAS